MADNAFVKILTALLKHQVKKVVGDETLGVIGQEIAALGGDKVDDQIKSWLGEKTNAEQLEKAAQTAQACFREKVTDNEIQQWMVSLPLGNLPKVVEAIDELPSSPDESNLENALRESVALNWKKLSSEQVDHAVNSFLSCLRSALLPIEKQTLMIIGRSVLRTEDKVDLLVRWFEQYIITGKSVEIKHLNPELSEGWYLAHPYPMPPNFTGRVEERKMLTDWLNKDNENRLFILRALGGFGKSALTWHWFNNNVDKATWQTAIWWSFYEKESGFDSFLTETLTHLGIETKDRSARQQVNDLLAVMQKTNVLIALDGFERLLRQYGRMDAVLQEDDEDAEIDPSQRDCTSQAAEVFLHGLSDKEIISKVLMTSRLLPRALESKDGKYQKRCREVSLKGFSPDDAVKHFHNKGIQATRAEIIEVCSKYDYHPLSLSLLVGLINESHEKRGDIEAVKNLEIFDDVKARKHHVMKRAYESLTPERRDLLSKISCFRGSMEYAVIKKVFPSPDLDAALLDLRKRGLLQYAGETQRYDMHPIVRHYAYDHFTDEKRRKEAHVELAMHFIDAMPATNTKVKTLEDLAPVIELYHHMVRAGNLDEALNLFYDRITKPTYYQFGAYQLRIELLRALFLDGEDKPPRLKRDDYQAFTLNALANSYSLSGQPRRAVPLFEMQIALREKQGDKKNLASGLGNVAYMAQIHIGALSEAERNLRRQIDLCREIEDEFREAVGHQELGRVLSYRGAWEEAEQELDTGLKLFEKQHIVQSEGIIWSYRALRFLFMAREEAIFDTRKSNNEYRVSAIQSAQRALELADEEARTDAPTPVDYMRAYWLLGAAYRGNSDLEKAEENLSKAISICRQINMVYFEADILLDIARLRYAQNNYEEAKSLADEALLITERCGYVLQGADVNLFLASLALEGHRLERLRFEGTKELSDKEIATLHAKEALKLASCDGPPYYYKVAYEEAERMLEQLAG
ncbi:MAG: hypothetical protein DCC56_00990 [Anaerolineae bacterium]|nr:MAG: hypothetical protein DCC56_00990 [Anaerolineae bacterium]WKZ44610.1 MAG: tetratricopeptide repeat protein [Anaerolineales bacterium]